MNIIFRYDDFLIEKEFEQIVNDIFAICESNEGTWIDDNTIKWDFADNNFKSKLKKFLQKLPKEKIKEYYIKLVNKIKSLPTKIRKKILIIITSIFITFVSLNYLITPTIGFSQNLTQTQVEEIKNLKEEQRTSSFEKAHNIVKISEAGYSNDKHDAGNWIKLKNGENVFVGTKYGISAPILQDYLGKTPTKEDMMTLSYDTAVNIYKTEYWEAQHLSILKDQNIANIIYDGCVNQGVTSMRSIMRKSFEENGLDIKDSDVIFSEEILSNANNLNQEKLFNSIKKHREDRYKKSKTFHIHGKGWLKRLNSFSYQEEINENKKISIFDSTWIKLVPKSLTIVTQNGKFTLTRPYDTDNIGYPVDGYNVMNEISFIYGQNTTKDGDVLKDAEPDQLQFDITLVKDNKGEQANPDSLRLNIDITYGDNMQYEFTIDKPNKVKVYHYTGKNSLYDPETFWGFSDESLQDLVKFFNRFGFETTIGDFKFIDSDPDSYSYHQRIEKGNKLEPMIINDEIKGDVNDLKGGDKIKKYETFKSN